MIREINKGDLNDEYFSLLCQLSGEMGEYDVDSLWDSYLEMKPGMTTFVAEDSGSIQGTATLIVENKFLHRGGKVGHIEDVVVDNNIRTRGLGRTLVEWCVQLAKDAGCYKVILDCSEKNIPFYVKCGFKPDSYCMRMRLECE